MLVVVRNEGITGLKSAYHIVNQRVRCHIFRHPHNIQILELIGRSRFVLSNTSKLKRLNTRRSAQDRWQ